jgi:hypothetical protein
MRSLLRRVSGAFCVPWSDKEALAGSMVSDRSAAVTGRIGDNCGRGRLGSVPTGGDGGRSTWNMFAASRGDNLVVGWKSRRNTK